MDEVRRRVIVSGRVQGVFFRDTCQQVAQRLGVRGWVRNRHDGTVEVAAEGHREQVDQLVEWCRTGPSRAHVTGIEVTEGSPTGEPGFTIRG